MSDPILDKLKSGTVIADGAIGSELMKLGLQAGENPELWNVEKKALVQQMHQVPFDMGAQRVVTTIKIDDRRDKPVTIDGKLNAVTGHCK